ncbi:hypothetical protein LJC45_01200 [Alistipes sp. OttesenSCG-928-B03]|nr:hypothetical protein [Alistipes sp. OttesenSCG-928-B03]
MKDEKIAKGKNIFQSISNAQPNIVKGERDQRKNFPPKIAQPQPIFSKYHIFSSKSIIFAQKNKPEQQFLQHPATRMPLCPCTGVRKHRHATAVKRETIPVYLPYAQK